MLLAFVGDVAIACSLERDGATASAKRRSYHVCTRASLDVELDRARVHELLDPGFNGGLGSSAEVGVVEVHDVVVPDAVRRIEAMQVVPDRLRDGTRAEVPAGQGERGQAREQP